MAKQVIKIRGQSIWTLRELLKPGLKAVFVGCNPASVSVEAGHYWQGTHGRRFWGRLQTFGIAKELPPGREDAAAFKQGFGFADLVRRPTRSAADLTRGEMEDCVAELVKRLKRRAPGSPAIVFVYKNAWKVAAPALKQAGYRVLRMPGPYVSAREETTAMRRVRDAIHGASGGRAR